MSAAARSQAAKAGAGTNAATTNADPGRASKTRSARDGRSTSNRGQLAAVQGDDTVPPVGKTGGAGAGPAGAKGGGGKGGAKKDQGNAVAGKSDDGDAAASDTGSVADAYVSAMDAAPSQMAARWSNAGANASASMARDEAAFTASAPTFRAKLVSTAPPAPVAHVAVAAAPAIDLGAHAPATPLAAPEVSKVAPSTGNQASASAAIKLAGNDPDALQRKGTELFAQLDTTPEVDADPGPSPTVDLSGGADPDRASDDETQGFDDAAAHQTDSVDSILKGPGPAQVEPRTVDTALTLTAAPKVAPLDGLEPAPGMEKVAGWNLDPKARDAFDSAAKPKMDAHLAAAKQQAAQASETHDRDRETAVNDVQKKADETNADFAKKQDDKIVAARKDIEGQQQATIDEQQTALDKVRGDSTDKKTSTLKDVDDRVKSDQGQIDKGYADAADAAKKEQSQGEEKAAAKKAEAEREANEDKSWWDRAVDAVASAIDAIASAIDDILTAVKNAVVAILDKVKQFAVDLINKARAFVLDLLDKFASWLKAALTKLLGDVFPGLVKALNAYIDKALAVAKAAVNAVADGLVKAVTALVDGLKKAVEKLTAVLRAAVKFVAALAKAAVTGDWAAVGKMLLEGILDLLGIDPAAFYAFIAKVSGTLDKIIDAPGEFVGHLIDAVKLGFSQFGDNFLEHLKDGILQWIFGAVAEAGIIIPKKFDIAGVFDLVLQVLGITKARLRAKAVKLIGEKNVARIEFVWKFVSAAIEGGLSGLWDKIKEFMGGLWDMVIGEAEKWLMTTLVKQALIKLVSLFNPVGAIVQLIMTAWDVYQWLRQNAKRIFELVSAVVDSLAEIASGQIQKAANWIEKALAKLMPIAISLLADIIGLGGIGEKIKEVITEVQAFVDQAIDKLIAKVVGFFKGVFGKGDDEKDGDKAKVPGTVGETVSFTAGSESHKLWIDVNGESATPMIASTPTTIPAWLDEIRPKIDALDDKEKKAKAEALWSQAQTMATALDADSDKTAKDEATAKAAEGGGEEKAPVEGGDVEGENAKVVTEEHSLADVISQLATLLGIDQPFVEVSRSGFAAVLVVEGKGFAALRIDGQETAEALAAAIRGPLRTGKSGAGRDRVAEAAAELAGIDESISSIPVASARISPENQKKIGSQADAAKTILDALGKDMKAGNLGRLSIKEPMSPAVTVRPPFKVKKTPEKDYDDAFFAEMTRQLEGQQAGINELTIDAWTVNVTQYSMNQETFELLDKSAREAVLTALRARASKAKVQAEKRRDDALKRVEKLSGEGAAKAADDAAAGAIKASKADAALTAIDAAAANDTAPPKGVLGKRGADIIGRQGNEGSFRDDHIDGIKALAKEWALLAEDASELAVLHNPDQIAGGYGDIPELAIPPLGTEDPAWAEYIKALKKVVGPSAVNGSIGPQWTARIDNLHADVTDNAKNPVVVFPITLVAVVLGPPVRE